MKKVGIIVGLIFLLLFVLKGSYADPDVMITFSQAAWQFIYNGLLQLHKQHCGHHMLWDILGERSALKMSEVYRNACLQSEQMPERYVSFLQMKHKLQVKNNTCV